jgi:beta-glucanase (GH16 family)
MTALNLTGYTLTFDDEFNSRSISQTGASTTWADIRPQWRYDANSDVGFGNSFFVDAASGYDPFSVQNGVLSITAKPDPAYPGLWESGLITTQGHFSQTYGYFEIRANFSTLPGGWDAFWLLPNQVIPDPNNAGHWQELDVVERYGSFDKGVYSGIHTTDAAPNLNWQNDLQVYSELAQPSGYHTYGMDWEQDTISFYVDGQLVGTHPTPSDMHGPMYLLADLATQNDPNNNANIANVPITSSIDYIRVYSSAVAGTGGTTIEAFGSTSLVKVGNNFYLDSNSSGSGPELKYAGAVVVAGQTGAWTPIGAEQTATGYEVAWKITGADQYEVWNTDSGGNYTSDTGVVSGTSATLELLETSFQQDLNGDGVIGPITTVIESSGSTSLVEAGSNFYLKSISSGSGPELKYAGAVVVAAQSTGAWTPIGAEQTATGYEVAWKVTGADQYEVWNTDSSGNYTSDTGVVSGTSTTLEFLETTFHQDLNGDGVIGLAVHAGATLELVGAASGSVTFISSAGTLKLDTPSTFAGPIFGFTGDGTLAGSDQIDLSSLTYNNAIQSQTTYNSSTGLLAVNNGTSTINLSFFGSYSLANFKFASDGHGGTTVYDPPVVPSGAKDAATQITGSNSISLAGAAQDTFLFKQSLGQATTDHFTPGPDTIQIKPAVFASVESLLSAIHDDSHGHFVITDAAHDTITVQNVTAAQLLAHQVGSYLV